MPSLAIQNDLLGWRTSPPGRMAVLTLIVLLHLLAFYGLQRGLHLPELLTQPKEIVATMISLEPETAAQPPTPTPPKTVPIIKNTVTPKAPTPVVHTTPSPNAITAPKVAPAPQPSEPATAPAAAPAATPAPAQPKTIAGVEYIKKVEPDYPIAAQRAGEDGVATFRVLINEQGRAESAELQQSTGSSRLDASAKQSVLRSLYKPYTENGRALPVHVTVPVRFSLE